jgi:type II secretory pathway predicted ATPase ExeA
MDQREQPAATDDELDTYLDELGWDRNPFRYPPRLEGYVIRAAEEIGHPTRPTLTSAIRSYSGPILIHSRYSSIGKTTLVRLLLEDYSDRIETAYVDGQDATAKELAAVVADRVGIDDAPSLGRAEREIRETVADRDGNPYLLGIDDFALTDPESMDLVQSLADLNGLRIMLTGPTSQWDGVSEFGDVGQAFQQCISFHLELEPFERAQTTELVKRRATIEANGTQSINSDDIDELKSYPFTDSTLDLVHQDSNGVPGMITAACAELVDVAAMQYGQTGQVEISPQLVETIEYDTTVLENTCPHGNLNGGK